MKKEQGFRKTMVGGFNRRDVIDYLANMAKERREETEALRAGAEKLRRERDDARESAVIPPKGTPEQEYEDMRLRFYKMRSRLDESQALSEALVAERDAAKAELALFRKENAVFINDRDLMDEALTRSESEKAALVEDRAALLAELSEALKSVDEMRSTMERVGATREKLESDVLAAKEQLSSARAQAEAVRLEAAKLIEETRERFESFISAGRSAALEMVLELDRSRSFYTKFEERFEDAAKAVAELSGDPRPRVKEFNPRQFEEGGGIG